MFIMTKRKYNDIISRLYVMEGCVAQLQKESQSTGKTFFPTLPMGTGYAAPLKTDTAEVYGISPLSREFTAAKYSSGDLLPSDAKADVPFRLGKNNMTARKILSEILPQNGGFELFSNAYPRFLAHPEATPLKLTSFNAMLARLTREGFLARGRSKGYYRLVLAKDAK